MKSYVKFAYDLYRTTLEGSLTFAYQGGFDTSITDNVLTLTEKNLNYLGEEKKVRKKIFNIMVECLQNICKHRMKDADLISATQGMFLIKKNKDFYYITTGNPIDNKDVNKLRSKLEKVNTMDDKALKEFYTEVLMEETLSEKGGAGLGLIDIARKSGEKLNYHFEPIDETISYYYLQTKLKSQNDSGKGAKSKGAKSNGNNGASQLSQVPLKETLRFHKSMYNRHMILFYAGEFDQNTVLNVLSMTESNIKAQNQQQIRLNIIGIIVELLQNISHHGKLSEINDENPSGVFIMAEDEGSYIISAGNLVGNQQVSLLEKRLERINNMDEEELHNYYDQEILKEGNDNKQKRAQLGLIDLALKTDRALKYDFRNLDDKGKFFFLQVIV